MYYTIYRMTNNLDGKFYIGMHQTKRLDDGYIGSGKLLKRAITKHGEENFSKEILFIFDCRQDMIDKEIELITEDLVKNPNCYNLTVGGWGGNRITDPNHPVWVGVRSGTLATSQNKKYAEDPAFRSRYCSQRRQNMTNNHIAGKIKYDTFTGKTHSEATKLKMSKSKRGKGVGEANSQAGTMWITNGEVNKKVKKGDDIPLGFRVGRV
jgi:group I intron endonuclease